MQIGGLQKLTLLDFPGRVACTVFLQGCNFRCPFCHNTPLVVGGQDAVRQQDFFALLKKRRGLLDAVVVSGGEPLLHPDIEAFLQRIRAEGYAIKLDTNGSFPARLRRLLQAGLVDYVAMDIKNSPEKYEATSGAAGILPAVEESAAILLDAAIPCEFRTTVVDELHEPSDFDAIGRWLQGANAYYLQGFVDSGHILCGGLHAASEEKMRRCLAVVRNYLPQAQLRGME